MLEMLASSLPKTFMKSNGLASAGPRKRSALWPSNTSRSQQGLHTRDAEARHDTTTQHAQQLLSLLCMD